jgi:RNA polymerase sigma-70 factor (ECF subfamily)
MGLALYMTDRDFPAVSAREDTLDSGIAMEAFLREVETRAFRIALVSVRDRDEALDIVQDSMIRLVRRYARRASDEWRPLFYRILQNRIRDSQRRRTVRSRVLSFFGGIDEGEYDPIVDAAAPSTANPLEELEQLDAMQALEQALRALPARQREAFTLRNFEGLDVAQTAAAMGCTEGSVKTHYSRAVHRLRELLGEHVAEDRS